MPCPRHGYCEADWSGSRSTPEGGSVVKRARPRTRGELLDQLQREPVVTIKRLRRQRFSLGLIAAAARDGQLTIDSFEPEAEVVLRTTG
jgi:hypothetical protein